MSDTYSLQQKLGSRRGTFMVGLYAWLTAVAFGITLLDIVYVRLVPDAVAAFSEVADFLLLVSAAFMILALAAIGMAWNSIAARNYLVASLVVFLIGSFAPLFLSPFIAAGSAWGAAIRLAIGGGITILAVMGFYHFRSGHIWISAPTPGN